MKSKILGTDRKQIREHEIEDSAKKTTRNSSDEDDEDGRKGVRQVKRVRLDPFALPTKKKKRNTAINDTVSAPSSSKLDTSSISEVKVRKPEGEMEEKNTNSLKRKRRKWRRRKNRAQLGKGQDGG